MRIGCLALVLSIVPWGAAPALADGTGAGEVSLDRAAVQAVLNSALPLELNTPPTSELTLAVEQADALRFTDGGVEARISFSLQPIDFHGALLVRYEPRVEPTKGVVTLEPVSATPDLPLPVRLDLAALLPAAPLPRQLSWTLDAPGERGIRLTGTVQGLEIDDERIVVLFGLRSETVGSR